MKLFKVLNSGEVAAFDPTKDSQAEVEQGSGGLVVFAQDKKDAKNIASEYGVGLSEGTMTGLKQYLYNIGDSSVEEYTPDIFPMQRKKLSAGKSILVIARNSADAQGVAKTTLRTESSPTFFTSPVGENKFFVTKSGKVFTSKDGIREPHREFDADTPQEALHYAKLSGYVDTVTENSTTLTDFIVYKNGKVMPYTSSAKQDLSVSKGKAIIVAASDEDDAFDAGIEEGFLEDIEESVEQSPELQIKYLAGKYYNPDEFLALPTIRHIIDDAELDQESISWISKNTESFINDTVDVYQLEPELLVKLIGDLKSIL